MTNFILTNRRVVCSSIGRPKKALSLCFFLVHAKLPPKPSGRSLISNRWRMYATHQFRPQLLMHNHVSKWSLSLHLFVFDDCDMGDADGDGLSPKIKLGHLNLLICTSKFDEQVMSITFFWVYFMSTLVPPKISFLSVSHLNPPLHTSGAMNYCLESYRRRKLICGSLRVSPP